MNIDTSGWIDLQVNGFLGADFSAITLSGKIVTPAGKTEGYEVRFPGAAV